MTRQTFLLTRHICLSPYRLKALNSAGLSNELTRLQPTAPEFLGAPDAVIVTEY